MTDNILIFRTSIEKRREIKKIEKLFTQYPQIHVWNVDFEDWEKILRIECHATDVTDVGAVSKTPFINMAYQMGYCV